MALVVAARHSHSGLYWHSAAAWRCLGAAHLDADCDVHGHGAELELYWRFHRLHSLRQRSVLWHWRVCHRTDDASQPAFLVGAARWRVDRGHLRLSGGLAGAAAQGALLCYCDSRHRRGVARTGDGTRRWRWWWRADVAASPQPQLLYGLFLCLPGGGSGVLADNG